MATTRLEVASGSDQLNGGRGQDLAIYFHPSEGDANVIGPINVQLAAGTVTTFTDASERPSTRRHAAIDRTDRRNKFWRYFQCNRFWLRSASTPAALVSGRGGRFTQRIRGSRVETTPITGNGNTRVSYEHALAGVTVAFLSLWCGNRTRHRSGRCRRGRQ